MGSLAERLLQQVPVLLLVFVFVAFGLWVPEFLAFQTLLNVASQAAYVGIIAVGMTFVLLVAGIDLSVGAVMYLTATIASKMLIGMGLPLWVALPAVVLVGALVGLVNAFGVIKLRVAPFIVTFGTLAIFRGGALDLSESQSLSFSQQLLDLGSARVYGIPMPIIIFAIVCLVAQVTLSSTTFGRNIYAVGRSAEGALRAGIPVGRVLVAVYVISGVLATIGGFVAVAQIGVVTPGFGSGKEFDAIAAAVLGGTSLFGGRGKVFPGTVIGALLIQLIAAGLVFAQVDLYMQPLVTAGVIFLAVLLDSVRTKHLQRLARRRIRPLEVPVPEPATA